MWKRSAEVSRTGCPLSESMKFRKNSFTGSHFIKKSPNLLWILENTCRTEWNWWEHARRPILMLYEVVVSRDTVNGTLYLCGRGRTCHLRHPTDDQGCHHRSTRSKIIPTKVIKILIVAFNSFFSQLIHFLKTLVWSSIVQNSTTTWDFYFLVFAPWWVCTIFLPTNPSTSETSEKSAKNSNIWARL